MKNIFIALSFLFASPALLASQTIAEKKSEFSKVRT